MQSVWLNPNFTPAPGADLMPWLTAPWPAEICEDTHWLVTRHKGGFAVTDLWLQVTVVTEFTRMDDLQAWASKTPDLFDNI